jgi:hypothetical protein
MASINLDKASRLDIKCRRGDTFTMIMTFTSNQSTDRPYDGWKMEVRDAATNDDSVIIASSSIAFSDYDAAGTTLTVTISSSVMKDAESGQYVYDIQHQSSDTPPVVETFLYGTFTIVEDVTITA